MSTNIKWEFSPVNLDDWNNSTRRLLFVAAEPNGGNENSGSLDMGDWFRTAIENEYHKNKKFYNRTVWMADGIHEKGEQSLRHTRFFDLKATPGGAQSNKKEVKKYIEDNRNEILRYFGPGDREFGLSPHVIIMLGNDSYSLFNELLKSEVLSYSQDFKWVRMPHPSAQTISNEHFQEACKEINSKLLPLSQDPWKWFCKGKANNGWKKA